MNWSGSERGKEGISVDYFVYLETKHKHQQQRQA